MITPSNNQDIIIANHLCLGFNNEPLVSDIHFQIHQGEFIGIFGQNGSGKSTFLKTLLGFITPISGKILLFGKKPLYGHPKIGYMPQTRTPSAIANLTSRAILEAAYEGTRYGIPLHSKSKKTEIERVLETIQANDCADRPFNQLSGGEKQRIFLAQALLGSPDVLLLDEPLSNLDFHYQELFVHLLQDIQKQLNVTILFTAHDPNPLLPVMDRVLFFANKKAIMGTVNEVITSAALSSLYETPIEVIQLHQRLFVLGEGRNILGEEAHHDS